MITKLSRLLLAVAVAVLSLPGVSWACAMPCGMSQAQMAACARAAADQAKGAQASIGRRPCVVLEVHGGLELATVHTAMVLEVPQAFVSMVPASIQDFAAVDRPFAGTRGPPDPPSSQFFVSTAPGHAPPSVI